VIDSPSTPTSTSTALSTSPNGQLTVTIRRISSSTPASDRVKERRFHLALEAIGLVHSDHRPPQTKMTPELAESSRDYQQYNFPMNRGECLFFNFICQYEKNNQHERYEVDFYLNGRRCYQWRVAIYNPKYEANARKTNENLSPSFEPQSPMSPLSPMSPISSLASPKRRTVAVMGRRLEDYRFSSESAAPHHIKPQPDMIVGMARFSDVDNSWQTCRNVADLTVGSWLFNRKTNLPR
jgi:hypothetical protein